MSTKRHIWQERKRVFAIWIYMAPFINGFYVMILNKKPIERKFDPNHVVGTYFDRQMDAEKCLKEVRKFVLENYESTNWIDDQPVHVIKEWVA